MQIKETIRPIELLILDKNNNNNNGNNKNQFQDPRKAKSAAHWFSFWVPNQLNKITYSCFYLTWPPASYQAKNIYSGIIFLYDCIAYTCYQWITQFKQWHCHNIIFWTFLRLRAVSPFLEYPWGREERKTSMQARLWAWRPSSNAKEKRLLAVLKFLYLATLIDAGLNLLRVFNNFCIVAPVSTMSW